MNHDHVGPAARDAHDVRSGLLEANDHKIRRVLAVVDEAADPAVNKALLDMLRPRLAALRPLRPLRFARLLFFPIDPLTVPLHSWRPGSATVPRPTLAPIARLVRAGMREQAQFVDKMIAGRKTDAVQTITEAGEILWPRAATVLAASPPPLDWRDTALPLSAFRPLARSIASVLRRAAALRSLARDEAFGAQTPDEAAANDILDSIANEPPAGCAMIARLLLLRSPHAAQILARIAGAGRTATEKSELRDAIDLGLVAVLTQMERDSGFVQEIGNGALGDVAGEALRVSALLRAIEADHAFSDQWPRLKAIRQRLADMCHERFTSGQLGLVAALTASSARVDARGQTELEASARSLRKLQTVARGFGGAADYDRMLRHAADTVRRAANAGALTPMREFRLIEILAGSDAAEALYNEAVSAT